MTLNELCRAAHENAKAKGWWDEDRSPLEIYALVHSEISEAVEHVRLGNPPIVYGGKFTVVDGEYVIHDHDAKPDGELIEIADAIIRLADYCGLRGWDLEEAVKLKMEYNKTRPHKHGKLL